MGFITQRFINDIMGTKLRVSIKETAIAALLRIETNNGANFFKDADNLSEAFIWDKTIEGFEFWREINGNIYKLE